MLSLCRWPSLRLTWLSRAPFLVILGGHRARSSQSSCDVSALVNLRVPSISHPIPACPPTPPPLNHLSAWFCGDDRAPPAGYTHSPAALVGSGGACRDPEPQDCTSSTPTPSGACPGSHSPPAQDAHPSRVDLRTC